MLSVSSSLDPSVTNILDPDQAQHTLGLIWIQNVCHSNGIPEIFFESNLEKNQQMTKEAWEGVNETVIGLKPTGDWVNSLSVSVVL